MTLQEWKSTPSAPLEKTLLEALDAPRITLTAYASRNELLQDPDLWTEVGYQKTKEGVWQVSCFCPMPGVKADMIRWWFWWHPRADLRYEAWYPEMHHAISYRKKDAGYFLAHAQPSFRDNVQYPTETIGQKTMECTLSFVTPEEMGFQRDLLRKSGVSAAVCAHVGMARGLVMHTEMTHLFLEWEDGLFMVSRFWLGQRLPNRFLREKIITRDTARGMCEHCLVEYRNLAVRLPDLYRTYGPEAEGSRG
ncbi:MAG: DAPG hydrolase family protein [Lachnospiraceae bacterium]